MGVWYIMSTPFYKQSTLFNERFPPHIIDKKKRKVYNDQKKEYENIRYMIENPTDTNGNYNKAQSALALAARQDGFRDCDPNCCDLLTAKAKDAIEGITSLLNKLTPSDETKTKTKTDGGKKSRKSHNSKKSRKSKRSRTTYKRSRR